MLCTFISCYVVKVEMMGEIIPVLEENNRHYVRQHYSRSNIEFFLICFILLYYNTGLFVSPSGISDPCGTVAGMVTPKGSMSTEGETLQVSVLPYRCSIC